MSTLQHGVSEAGSEFLFRMVGIMWVVMTRERMLALACTTKCYSSDLIDSE